jgi:hypothetical protein
LAVHAEVIAERAVARIDGDQTRVEGAFNDPAFAWRIRRRLWRFIVGNTSDKLPYKECAQASPLDRSATFPYRMLRRAQ